MWAKDIPPNKLKNLWFKNGMKDKSARTSKLHRRIEPATATQHQPIAKHVVCPTVGQNIALRKLESAFNTFGQKT